MSVVLPIEDREVRAVRAESWRRRFIGQNAGRCHYCNRVGTLEMGPGGQPWHIDHMTPIALGGTDDEDNLTLACKRCNLAKNIKPYKLFKALAASAYWTPGEGGPSEAELDHLAHLHYRSNDVRLSLPAAAANGIFTEDGSPAVMRSYVSEGEDAAGQPLYIAVDGSTGSDPEQTVAAFLTAAHRLVPALIAEVYLLRARVADLESA